MICPCKDCTDRQQGCHAKCEKYNAWATWRKDELEKEKEFYSKFRYERDNRYGPDKTQKWPTNKFD